MEMEFYENMDRKLFAAILKENLRTKPVRISTFFFDMAALFYAIRVAIDYFSGRSIAVSAFLVIFILGMFHIVLPIAIRAKIKLIYKDMLGKTIHYKISDDGIDTESEYGTSHILWKSVKNVLERDDYVLIQLAVKNGAVWIKKDEVTPEQLLWLLNRYKRG